MERHIEVFNHEKLPTQAVLQAACTLFQENTPIFDEENVNENLASIAMRATPVHYRKLLEGHRTLLLAFNTHERVVGLLEWDERDYLRNQDALLAYIVWLMVDVPERGKGLSTYLHKHFEGRCLPGVIKNTEKTVYQALGVHFQNPAAHIYRRWGYADQFPSRDGRKLFMFKRPVRLSQNGAIGTNSSPHQPTLLLPPVA